MQDLCKEFDTPDSARKVNSFASSCTNKVFGFRTSETRFSVEFLICFFVVYQMVKLKAFEKFDNTSEALEAVAKLLEGAPSKGLRKFLKANCQGETLAVADSKLGNVIKEKLVCNSHYYTLIPVWSVFCF